MKYFFAIFFLSISVQAYTCQKKYCKNMTSCAEAYYQYKKCGFHRLDRDNDGIPCENICGKTLEEMKSKPKRGD